jgi:hypothetical protein
MLSYEDAQRNIAQEEQSRRDVVTIAQEARAGNIGIQVSPVSNGFIVAIGYEAQVVCVRPNDVGLLIRTSQVDGIPLTKRRIV